MNIYLAEIDLRTHSYPDTNGRETVTRLVIAEDEDDAERKIKEVFTKDDPYGYDVQVEHVELHAAIGGPIQVVS